MRIAKNIYIGDCPPHKQTLTISCGFNPFNFIIINKVFNNPTHCGVLFRSKKRLVDVLACFSICKNGFLRQWYG